MPGEFLAGNFRMKDPGDEERPGFKNRERKSKSPKMVFRMTGKERDLEREVPEELNERPERPEGNSARPGHDPVDRGIDPMGSHGKAIERF